MARDEPTNTIVGTLPEPNTSKTVVKIGEKFFVTDPTKKKPSKLKKWMKAIFDYYTIHFLIIIV